jgi:putative ABC transport system permease protein
VVVYLSLPYLSELFERNLASEWKWDARFAGVLAAALLISCLITGSYPAWVMASISPAEILKGKFVGGKRGQWLRKVMVLVPVTATVVLLISILVIFLQMNLLRKKDLGFDMDRLLMVRSSEIFDSLFQRNTQVFKKEIAGLAGVEQVTMVSERPGNQIRLYANSVRRIEAPKEDVNQYRYFFVDEHFTETMGLKVLAGNPIHPGYRLDKDVMINETACKLLGFLTPEQALEQRVIFRDDTATVRAVVGDYYHQSPKVPIVPTFFVYLPSQCNHYLIRLADGAKAPIAAIDEKFRQLFTAEVPNIMHLKDYYYKQYEAEDRFGSLVLYFSVVLIAISCAGLFSISSYAARQRAREIGIRKVLGATTADAVRLLLKEYLLLLAVAMVVGIPIAWFALEHWLQSFTIRVYITWWMVAVPALVVSAIILLTVLKQTLATARTSPAEVLKYE